MDFGEHIGSSSTAEQRLHKEECRFHILAAQGDCRFKGLVAVLAGIKCAAAGIQQAGVHMLLEGPAIVAIGRHQGFHIAVDVNIGKSGGITAKPVDDEL